MAIPFPNIDPVLVTIPLPFELGSVPIRWYALAYIVGFVMGWRYILFWERRRDGRPGCDDVDDFLSWAIIGVILGGRLGYSLFYQSGYYLSNPMEILKIWHGGMSFHGGVIGLILVILWRAKARGYMARQMADYVVLAAPIGLFFGRIANFINGELYGRVTDAPWGMVFPGGGPDPRHPSQLYEATLEGLCLFVLLSLLAWRTDILKRPGHLSGVFLIGYAISRVLVELVREPDAHLGLLLGGFSMGQWLSLPMIMLGGILLSLEPHRAKSN